MKPFAEIDKSKFISYPEIDKNHQPWDAADSYLYTHLLENDLLFDGAKIIILNDDCGVLTYLLRDYKPTVTSDSIFSRINIEQNFVNYGENVDQFNYIDSVEFATTEQPHYDIILMRIPKASRYMVDQIAVLSRCTDEKTIYLSAGMVKHISEHTRETLEKRVGETHTHRVEKKAVLFSSTHNGRSLKERPTTVFDIPDLGEFESYSNTFSNGRLDKGTAALLPYIRHNLSGRVVDLGSGYGIITRYLKQNCPDISELIAVDSSRMSAETTLINNPTARVLWDDGLTHFENDSIDAVVSNPPFHLDTSFSVAVGLRLLKQVSEKLITGGEFIMVSNSGLNYNPYLKRLFVSVEEIKPNRRYTVFVCKK